MSSIKDIMACASLFLLTTCIYSQYYCMHIVISDGKFTPAEHQVSFWPLNSEHKGTNLVGGKGDFALRGVNFNSQSKEWSHPPARFTGQAGSFAEILKNSGIKMSGSFSWIGAVNRKATGDGALFEWDNGNLVGTHVWIYKNKLYTNVLFHPRCGRNMFHTVPIANNKSYVFAVSFNKQKKLIEMWVNGKKVQRSAAGCSMNLMPADNVRISRR